LTRPQSKPASKVRLPSSKIAAYAADPLVFLGDLKIPGADGPAIFRSIWADFQVDFFKAIAPCLDAVARGRKPPVRGFWLERTKGTSKDSDVGMCLLWLLLFSRVPLLVELGADNKDQAGETHKAMQSVVHLNPWMQQYLDIQVSKVICPSHQVTCEFITTHETGAHGSRPHVTVCNELSHVSKEAFMQTMMDNASKIPTNLAIVATNAGMQRTWQWRWREGYRQRKRWWFQKIDFPAPWLDKEDMEESRIRNSTTRFNRLWGGIWGTGAGDAIDYADITRAVRLLGPMLPAEVAGAKPPWVFCAGADAGVRHDHAALVVLGARYGVDVVRVVSCRSWAPGPSGRVDLPAFKQAIVQANHDWQLAAVNFDPSQMEFMAQQLELEEGLLMNPIPFSGPNCNTMARDLLSAFRGGQIEMYNNPQLINDLSRLTIAEKSFGYKLEAASDEEGHADRAVALAIALPQALYLCQSEPPDDNPDRPPERITV